MRQKKLMLLGGSRYLLPVIKKAHELGLYVITCDYLPDNDAHKYADEYVNASVVEKDEVLAVAQEKAIDGIMSFACDPGVATAAYVAEKMGLPFQCSYESAEILQDKGLFRKFLLEHGFNSPYAKSYAAGESPLADADYFHWPVIVKPVDSAGSKGVSRVECPEQLPAAIEKALACSHTGHYIVEDFLEFESCHSSTDMFTVDGKLCAVSYSDHQFDMEAANPYTPAFIIWPSTMVRSHQDYLTRELQRLMDLLQMRTGIYNIETVVGKGGMPYIMEVSPRGGGGKIAELQEMAFGANLIENEVKKAIGFPLAPIRIRSMEGFWCKMVIHTFRENGGIFEELTVRDDVLKSNVRLIDMYVKKGDHVYPFTGANRALGDMFLQFKTRTELDDAIKDTSKWLKIGLKEQNP